MTAAGPQLRQVMHDLAVPSFQPFARHWGYEVEAVDLAVDGEGTDAAAQRAKWAKLTVLRSALGRHALVLWLDADVLLLRDDEDIADLLAPGDFQALALEQVPSERRTNPNTGVWLMRSCPASFAFLDAVDAAGPQPGPWADQGAVLAALGWDRGDDRYRGARPGAGSPFLAGTSWLPTSWNQPWVGERDEDDAFGSRVDSYRDRPVVPFPHAVHFMGMRPQARARRMTAVAATRLPHARLAFG